MAHLRHLSSLDRAEAGDPARDHTGAAQCLVSSGCLESVADLLSCFGALPPPAAESAHAASLLAASEAAAALAEEALFRTKHPPRGLPPHLLSALCGALRTLRGWCARGWCARSWSGRAAQIAALRAALAGAAQHALTREQPRRALLSLPLEDGVGALVCALGGAGGGAVIWFFAVFGEREVFN